MIVSIISLDITLLIINNYFRSSLKESVHFGLAGVNSFETYYPYSEYQKICISDLSSLDICNSLSDLAQAGTIVKAFLCLDIIISVFYSVFTTIEHFILKKIITKSVSLDESPKTYKFLFTWSYRGKAIIVLHCIFINIALGSWISKSNIEKFSSEIIVEQGVIIFIFQCFFSLLVLASYFWEISTMKRRNLRKINKKTEKKHVKDLSLDEKSFNTAMKF